MNLTSPTPPRRPARLIALEEHFLHAGVAASYDEVDRALLSPSRVPGLDELGDARIQSMDEAGITMQVLSHTKPGVQDMTDARQAVLLACAANDYLAEAVALHPDRFAGFATLATSEPAEAARELERSVRQLGFKGAMINGHTRGAYLDQQRFWPIFEAAEALDVPIYLHPANPHPAVYEAYYKDYPSLGYAPWGYAVETGTHVLRLILSGVLDRYPRLRMIIGHMGELLPFALWRADGRLTPKYPQLKKSVREYFLDHFSVTTAGVFSTPELMCTASIVGFDNMLFSVDYPFESNVAASTWFESLPIADTDRAKLAHLNAERILKL
ncbi:amidohydrolase family protein [Candidimonas humi]|uniref:Amidohydrolase family protein n=1 Tax=Candidimonas humi TaxID=683355 RepID=A0ABV8NVL8_9BURK|nr:amidohydrolase family protein [Candidimonas humi]MBV6307051.1 amidohydrolase family protein [Candidimonas humi]